MLLGAETVLIKHLVRHALFIGQLVRHSLFVGQLGLALQFHLRFLFLVFRIMLFDTITMLVVQH